MSPNITHGKRSRRKQGTNVAGHPGVKEAHVLGVVYTINPCQGEGFYLRLLLHHIRGPQSFTQLKTVEGDLAALSVRYA